MGWGEILKVVILKLFYDDLPIARSSAANKIIILIITLKKSRKIERINGKKPPVRFELTTL